MVNGVRYMDFFFPTILSSSFSMCCAVLCLVAQSCPTLCDPVDYSLPVFSVHGISQARILEWVAISFSRHLKFFFNDEDGP